VPLTTHSLTTNTMTSSRLEILSGILEAQPQTFYRSGYALIRELIQSGFTLVDKNSDLERELEDTRQECADLKERLTRVERKSNMNTVGVLI
jgi:cell shape-determining protein MreC